MEYNFPERRFVRESRPFDYVYDHVYTASSRKDFCTAADVGVRLASEIKLRPVYKSMFSELVGDKRMEGCLVDKQPCLTQSFLPPCNTNGHSNDCYSPLIGQVDPAGAHRAIFALKYMGDPEYKKSHPIAYFNLQEEIRRVSKSGKTSRASRVCRGVQTDYRESETQTDPYSPPFTLPYPEAYPRVLALMNMTWGKGLPPTMDDIVSIERALTRRLAEMTRNNLDDEGEFSKRTELMEELEAQLWADRERELQKIMLQKLELIKKIHHDIKAKFASEDTMRLERMFDAEKKKNAKIFSRIRHTYLREIRKLEKKFCKMRHSSQVETILTEYKNEIDYMAESKIGGLNHRRLPEYDSKITTDFNVFNNLTSCESFKNNYLKFDCQRFAKCIMKSHPTHRERRVERLLDEAFIAFRTEAIRKIGSAEANRKINEMVKNQSRRIITPTVTGPSIEEEMAEHAVILIQKVIRGRTVQSMMRDEIRSNASILFDVKALHKMDPNGFKATFGEIAATRLIQKERDLQIREENEISEITDQLEGETLGQQLNFLEKEMVRLQDERKIHCLLMLAERERRMKEAIEAGRRQEEEDNRRVNDEIFRQIVGIHQSTVDMYLEDMYLDTIERTADANARGYVQNLATTLNEASYLMQKSAIDDSEEMTADIVHSFLMPEMNRIYQRQRMEALNNRYLRASTDVAHAACAAQGVVREMIDSLGPTVNAHLNLGEAAVDGAQIAVDTIIKEAVGKIFHTYEPKTIEIVAEDETEQKEGTEHVVTEEVTEEESVQPDGYDEPILPLVPCLKTELGIKSIELATGTEIGIDAVNLFLASKHVTCAVIEEAVEFIQSCFQESEPEDEELDVDDYDGDVI